MAEYYPVFKDVIKNVLANGIPQNHHDQRQAASDIYNAHGYYSPYPTDLIQARKRLMAAIRTGQTPTWMHDDVEMLDLFRQLLAKKNRVARANSMRPPSVNLNAFEESGDEHPAERRVKVEVDAEDHHPRRSGRVVKPPKLYTGERVQSVIQKPAAQPKHKTVQEKRDGAAAAPSTAASEPPAVGSLLELFKTEMNNLVTRMTPYFAEHESLDEMRLMQMQVEESSRHQGVLETKLHETQQELADERLKNEQLRWIVEQQVKEEPPEVGAEPVNIKRLIKAHESTIRTNEQLLDEQKKTIRQLKKRIAVFGKENTAERQDEESDLAPPPKLTPVNLDFSITTLPLLTAKVKKELQDANQNSIPAGADGLCKENENSTTVPTFPNEIWNICNKYLT